MEPDTIEIKNAREHNLQSVSLSLPRNSLICFTGVSGSGKSSLAFDTLYAEGQRRYIESLSSYARQFMGQMQKPDCDLITGLSPSIAIQQKTTGWNPRSTVGTVTAIHDFLRVLFARVGVQHCTECGKPITAQTIEQILGSVFAQFGGEQSRARQEAVGTRSRGLNPTDKGAEEADQSPLPHGRDSENRILILAPVARGQKGEFRDLFDDLIRAGFVRARVDGEVVSLTENLSLQKNQRHDIEVVIDRLTVKPEGRSRLSEAVQGALTVGKGTLIVARMEDDKKKASGKDVPKETAEERIYSSKYACTRCGISFEPPSPQLFSFNSPAGMCLTCDGLGEQYDFDSDLLVPDPTLSFLAPAIAPMKSSPGKWRRHIYEGVARAVGFDLKTPWKDLPMKARDALLYGTGDRHITYEWRWSGGVWKHGDTFAGVIAELREKYRKAKAGFVRQYYEKYMRRGDCTGCGGSRLNGQACAVRLALTGAKEGGPNMVELCKMSVAEARDTLDQLTLTPVQKIIAEEVLKEVRSRLEFLLNVGLHYLALDRIAPSLSGGELQRIRLAGQIGSGLVGVLYVLDEPSIGLHPRDNKRLLESLERLRDMGNTVIVVEHDEETMQAADYIVDFGPGPGVRGGQIVASGDYAEIVANQQSLTGKYLSGEMTIEIPKTRRPVKKNEAEGRPKAMKTKGQSRK